MHFQGEAAVDVELSIEDSDIVHIYFKTEKDAIIFTIKCEIIIIAEITLFI